MTRRYSQIGRPVQAKGVVHKLVAQTAKDMCRCYYEEAAHDNDFYRKWPTSDDFLVRRWHMFIQPARTHLAELLHPSKHSLSTPEMRDQIHEALLKQAAVNPAYNSPLH
jgi:hypothetical protein